ncbi:hypothetical protein [Alcanivorax sp.]|uniref:hypothetical protein n=1 Tax=Alcanivorax sp. TaxID=1872427 RepID=UPI0025BA9DB4|nr:hypothetical protein [Alcanivorax sp.]|tara:strand:- start:1440 stop:1721 length:282 start_codon:yes stop_codon:yes gene_type:complete
MKKWMIAGAALMLSGLVVADSSYEFGLSETVSNPQRATVTDWLLEQQRKTPVAESSELPAQLYVDSQRRIGDTFKSSIPESLQERANSLKQNN